MLIAFYRIKKYLSQQKLLNVKVSSLRSYAAWRGSEVKHVLLHKINRLLETLKFTVHFTQPISGWIRVQKIATGYMGAAIFESLQLMKRVIVNLILLPICIWNI